MILNKKEDMYDSNNDLNIDNDELNVFILSSK